MAALLERMKGEGFCLLRELRVGVSLRTVHKTGPCGGSSHLGKGGQTCTTESREEVEGQGRDGSCLEVKEMMNIDAVV